MTLKFTPELQEKFLRLWEQGLPKTVVCRTLGISVDTIERWIKQSALDLEDGLDTQYTQFSINYGMAEIKQIKPAIDEIRASEKSHRGNEFFLERSFPLYYSSNLLERENSERLDKLEPLLGGPNEKREQK